jgi:uncharacterized protein
MAIDVAVTADASAALAQAEQFLASDPVRHNVILTLLHGRAAMPEPGRYLIASREGEVVGVVFQSPLTFIATITPMGQEAAAACVDALTADGTVLPGVSGEAGAAARFAGQWTERTKSAAIPSQGQRIYEALTAEEPFGVPGELRLAVAADHALLVSWLHGFYDDTGEPGDDPESAVTQRVAAGAFWVWDGGGPKSMAALTAPVAGVVRVGAVYTPPAARRHGYASACVAGLTARTLSAGSRCILYTDLGNPTSNSIYRRIGYQAVAEVLRYDFT